jgi:ribosome-binding factor A
MADPARARRLAKRISEIVASAIEYEIKDPGLAGVTIVDAKVSGDLHDATLYYTVMGSTLDDEPDYAGAAAAREGCAAHQGWRRHRRSLHSHTDVHSGHGVRLRAANGRVAGPRACR